MPEVYLDHYAATQVLPEVVDAMQPLLRDGFGYQNHSNRPRLLSKK